MNGRALLEMILTRLPHRSRDPSADVFRHAPELSSMLDHLHEHVVYLDCHLRVRWANAAARAAAKAPFGPANCIGHPCYAIWHRRTTACPDCPVVSCLASCTSLTRELQTPSGRWWSIKAHPVFDRDGALAGVVLLSHEVTERVLAQRELRRKLAQQELIAKLAARLVPSATLDQLIPPTLADIGAMLSVDRVAVWQIDDMAGMIRCTWVWYAPGSVPFRDQARAFPRHYYTWSAEIVQRMHVLAVHDATCMPHDAAREQAFLTANNMRALLLVPLRAHENELGYLTCDCNYMARTWADDEIALLRTCAEILTSAFLRESAQQDVRRYQQQLEMLVDERTAKLQRANDHLTEEILTRIKTQDALLRTQADLAEAQSIASIGSWTYTQILGRCSGLMRCIGLWAYRQTSRRRHFLMVIVSIFMPKISTR